ncbi:preprotein translocase subunit SecG [Candidatus Woesebacteria bacterium]|nr:MAG: preprotein translocase subunit SecG [Candidatus Woesebacteria bacterium]
MENLLLVAQIITGILLTGAILIQTRGTGFGRGSSHASFTRRGLEKLVFRLTFVLVAIFVIVSILRLAI